MQATSQEIKRDYEQIKAEATLLAGATTDLTQRATTYHHLYQHSRGNHIFPLIAAHGALWAKRYFQFGMKLGQLFSLQYGWNSERRQAQLASLTQFAEAFRAINQQVCIDTYTSYHLVGRFGEHTELLNYMSRELLTALARLHWAKEYGIELPDEEKKAIFRAHFLNEQEHVVGPCIEAATNAIHWPLLEVIALRPVIRFAYFERQQTFWFRDFTNRDERIRRGLKAFDIGSKLGWKTVEAKLADYQTLPGRFFTHPVEHFSGMREQLLAIS